MQISLALKFLIFGLSSALISLFLTIIITPRIRSFALKNKIIDIPNSRKQKKSITVRVGGISIFLSYLFSIFVFLIVNYKFNFFIVDYKLFLIFLLSSLSFFSIGLIDDLKDLSPLLRLLIQFLISFFIWLNDIKISYFSFPFFNNEIQILIPTGISLLITIFWIVGIVNALNWVDGIDGLAVGIMVIAFFTFMIFALERGDFTLFLLICSILGTSIGFMRFNAYPSKILMGDGGSYLIAINIALLTLTIFTSSNQNSNSELIATDIITPFIVLALPILDSIRVCLNRIKGGYSPFSPDRSHLHHKLFDYGFSEEKTVIISCGPREVGETTTIK